MRRKKTCSEELNIEARVQKGLQNLSGQSTSQNGAEKPEIPKLQLIWGSTLYHIDDLSFDAPNIPDIYTQFHKVMSLFLSSLVVSANMSTLLGAY